jgi:hypothetical protein
MNEEFIDSIPTYKWNEIVQLSGRIVQQNGHLAIVADSLASSNYKEGSTGWSIKSNGDAEFNNGTFRGAIVGSTIDIGGNDSTSFHVDSAGRMWSGGSTYATSKFAVGSVASGGDGTVWINGSAATSRQITGTTGFVSRSQINLANSTAESGTNAGSNFSVSVFDDSGIIVATPLFIERKTGNVVISAFGTSLPHASSILEIQSTTKGVRFPNMTTTQRDNITPGAGTVIYNTTTGKLNVYTTAWEAITSA